MCLPLGFVAEMSKRDQPCWPGDFSVKCWLCRTCQLLSCAFVLGNDFALFEFLVNLTRFSIFFHDDDDDCCYPNPNTIWISFPICLPLFFGPIKEKIVVINAKVKLKFGNLSTLISKYLQALFQPLPVLLTAVIHCCVITANLSPGKRRRESTF